jgi:hypothetical protein
MGQGMPGRRGCHPAEYLMYVRETRSAMSLKDATDPQLRGCGRDFAVIWLSCCPAWATERHAQAWYQSCSFPSLQQVVVTLKHGFVRRFSPGCREGAHLARKLAQQSPLSHLDILALMLQAGSVISSRMTSDILAVDVRSGDGHACRNDSCRRLNAVFERRRNRGVSPAVEDQASSLL